MIQDGGVKNDRIIVDKELFWKFGLIKSMIIQYIGNRVGSLYIGTIRSLTKELEVFRYIDVWRAMDELKKDRFITMEEGYKYNNRYRFNGMHPRRDPPKCVADIVKHLERIKKEKKNLHNK